MSIKLERIAAEREKARRKRDEWDAKAKALDQKYREQENMEIHEMVHVADLTPEQLAEIIRLARSGNINPANMPQGGEFTQETEVDEDEN